MALASAYYVDADQSWPDQWGGALWFRENGRLYHPFHTSWASLGTKIKPCDYVNFYGHAGFFLYWIALPSRHPDNPPSYYALSNFSDDDDPQDEVDNFETIFKESAPSGDSALLRPAPFDPDSDINWFRIVSGNDGGRFRTSVGAVINLYRWRLDEVIKLLHESEYRKSFVPWCKNREVGVESFKSIDSPPGFGRTNGGVVVPEFKPDFE